MTNDFFFWLDDHADSLDCSPAMGGELLDALGDSGLLRVGVPEEMGGSGGTLSDAVAVATALSARSLTAAFVFWAQRAFIECLVRTPNRNLAADLMPELLDGRMAGATGLSNAIKSASGVEELKVECAFSEGHFVLNGPVPWASNLQDRHFAFVLAARYSNRQGAAVFAVPRGANGLKVSDDFPLIGLRSSRTAGMSLENCHLSEKWCLHQNAKVFLPAVRVALLCMQSGMCIGVAQASLDSAEATLGSSSPIVVREHRALAVALDSLKAELSEKAIGEQFREFPERLWQIRLEAVQFATSCVQLELEALGGAAFTESAKGFSRRLRETTFLPVLTPSVVQLKTELSQMTTVRN